MRTGKRGPKAWRYSWADLAQIFGVRVRTVQRWVWRREPLLDPGNLQSVVALLHKRGSR